MLLAMVTYQDLSRPCNIPILPSKDCKATNGPNRFRTPWDDYDIRVAQCQVFVLIWASGYSMATTNYTASFQVLAFRDSPSHCTTTHPLATDAVSLAASEFNLAASCMSLAACCISLAASNIASCGVLGVAWPCVAADCAGICSA